MSDHNSDPLWDGANERLAFLLGGLTACLGSANDSYDNKSWRLVQEWIKQKRPGVGKAFERGHNHGYEYASKYDSDSPSGGLTIEGEACFLLWYKQVTAKASPNE